MPSIEVRSSAGCDDEPMSDGQGVARVGQRPVVYRPRAVRSCGWDEIEPGWLVKRYSVSALREHPAAEVHEFARRAVSASLPEPHPDGPSCAFSVVHEDEDGCYVVVGWWSRNRLIMHSRTWLSDWAELDPQPAPAAATACVWELAAMAHERDAWVRHVVVREQPDVAGYLADTMAGDF